MSSTTAARAALAAHVQGATDAQLVGSLDTLALELDLARMRGVTPDPAKVRAKVELAVEHCRRTWGAVRMIDDAALAADLRRMATKPYGDMLASERNLLSVLEGEVERRSPGARAVAEAWLDGQCDVSPESDAALGLGYIHKLLEGAGL